MRLTCCDHGVAGPISAAAAREAMLAACERVRPYRRSVDVIEAITDGEPPQKFDRDRTGDRGLPLATFSGCKDGARSR